MTVFLPSVFEHKSLLQRAEDKFLEVQTAVAIEEQDLITARI